MHVCWCSLWGVSAWSQILLKQIKFVSLKIIRKCVHSATMQRGVSSALKDDGGWIGSIMVELSDTQRNKAVSCWSECCIVESAYPEFNGADYCTITADWLICVFVFGRWCGRRARACEELGDGHRDASPSLQTSLLSAEVKRLTIYHGRGGRGWFICRPNSANAMGHHGPILSRQLTAQPQVLFWLI